MVFVQCSSFIVSGWVVVGLQEDSILIFVQCSCCCIVSGGVIGGLQNDRICVVFVDGGCCIISGRVVCGVAG